MELISVREVIKTKGIVFFWKPKNCHDSHLAPEMGETHDELLEVDFAIAVIVKDVDDPPEIARYTMSTFLSKFFAFQTGRFLAAFLCLEVLRGHGQTFRAILLGRGISG